MTLVPVKPGGWDPEEILTSDDLNALQAEYVKAVDGTGGGSYELLDDLVFEGGLIRILSGLYLEDGGALGVDADSTFDMDGEMTMSGTEAISGDVNLQSTGEFHVLSGALLRVSGGGFLTAAASSIVTLGGTVSIPVGATVSIASTLVDLSGVFNVVSGGRVDVEPGGVLALVTGSPGGKITMGNGCEINVDDAEDITLNFSSFVFRLRMTPASMSWNAGVPMFMPWIGTPVWQMADVSTSGTISFAMTLLPGDRITTLRATLGNPTVNLHSAVPGIRPRLQLIAVNINGGETLVAEETDPVSTLPAYDDTHSIVMSGATHPSIFPYTVPTDALLLARITNERDGGSPGSASPNKTSVLSIDGTGEALHYRNTTEVH